VADRIGQRVAARMRSFGYRLVAPPESFYVHSATGPLRAGETDRACRWGEALGSAVERSGPIGERAL
jgi:hypothetical protein